MRYVTFYMSICAAFCCQFLSIPLFAQQQKVDTTHTYFIPEVTVSDIYQTREVRSTAPLQLFSKEALKNLHALQVSDAVKHFAGVTVKDYGGIGGLKTVSIRSLGAQHTAVGYDGIAITDCQTGQIDISRFSLDNVDQLSLSNGQSDNIFQPARFFASAGILDIQTLTPRFEKGKRTNISAAFKTGSWGLVNPSILLEQQLSPQWTVSANGEWMSSDGQYPYTLRYGNAADDLTSREKRKNTDVETFRAEAGLYGNFSDKEQWRLKAYYFQSSRGLPKATTLYNDFSAQHLWDKNTFIQSQYKKEFSRQWVFRTSAKWNWSYQHYLDPAIKNNEGKTENSSAGILSFRLRVIQAAEQSFVFIVYRRQYQHDECQHGRLCTSHTLFVVDSHCRKIRQRMVHSICFRLGNRYQRAGRQGRKRRQSPQINSLRQRHIQAFPE